MGGVVAQTVKVSIYLQPKTKFILKEANHITQTYKY